MNYLFRTKTDGYIFPMMSRVHIIVLLILFAGLLILKNKHKNYKKILIVSLVIEQIMLYSWYFFIKGFNPREALPLYSCRIAVIVILLALPFRSDIMKLFGSYLGFPGGVIAILFPVIESYSYPHITNFIYFIGHISLAWLSFCYLIELKADRSKLKTIFLYSHIYLIIAYSADKLIDSNYAYLNWSPIFTGFFDKFNKIVYLFIVYSIYLVILFMTYLINKKIAIDQED
ncbi:MAG: TIGR02206 family membrane protein [Tissierellia bacterium]|nr:TIGR02206 family membrane protein [Tissierellia bacterium]